MTFEEYYKKRVVQSDLAHEVGLASWEASRWYAAKELLNLADKNRTLKKQLEILNDVCKRFAKELEDTRKVNANLSLNKSLRDAGVQAGYCENGEYVEINTKEK